MFCIRVIRMLPIIKMKERFITPNPYGDIADCLMSDAPLWVLKQYPVLVIADELHPGQEINDKLNAYIGTLVVVWSLRLVH